MPKTQLEARVIQSYNAGSVRAFSGREYVRSEWRLVPVGYEDEARKNALLEVRAYQPEKKILEPVKVESKLEETPTPESEVVTPGSEETPVEEKKSSRSSRSSRSIRSEE